MGYQRKQPMVHQTPHRSAEIEATQVAMLWPAQVQQYSALRGYDNDGSQDHHHRY
jgi:hypothetical protein